MERNIKIVRILFAIPWLIFGIQHYMYADFVATLVPAFVPLKLFWAYFTGTAMIAAGISFIFNRAGFLAAMLLSVMLWLFVLMIHVPMLTSTPFAAGILGRPLQDVALAAACLLLAGTFIPLGASSPVVALIIKISRYIFALMLIAFGVLQFFNLDFETARIPSFLPLRIFWVYLMGAAMIITGICVIINRKARLSAIALGCFLLIINLLNHGYLLANDLHNPILWTGAMLDVAITASVFILAFDRNQRIR